ncbi:hypothetical protein FB45DRAFT_1131361 [Roridomyces roridus]|uniref:Uncharacterized protein n=1 Tax=Roridomyces roridus TaxID=1738132 RepID=A0AAD7FAP0_9AGAR|nr:hypothetical protein FB45DRAFT_1131361 [Roridomyces roridus]
MCDIATAVKSATLLWAIPLVPKVIASYTGLALGFTSTAIYIAYRKTPHQKLGRLQDAITATADVLNDAKQDCARATVTLLDLEDRLLQAQLTASETQVKLLKARDEETWTEYFDVLSQIMHDTNKCTADVREIHIETLLALEQEKQRKISSGMKDTREVLAAIQSPILRLQPSGCSGGLEVAAALTSGIRLERNPSTWARRCRDELQEYTDSVKGDQSVEAHKRWLWQGCGGDQGDPNKNKEVIPINNARVTPLLDQARPRPQWTSTKPRYSSLSPSSAVQNLMKPFADYSGGWPDVPPSEITEPPRLTQIIDTCTPDDSGFSSTAGETLNLPETFGDTVRYIDLERHEDLDCFSQIGTEEAFIVRQEYTECIQHALRMSITEQKFRVFITGQSGIGITVGAHHFLFCLLALGKPVFWVTDNVAFISTATGCSCHKALFRRIRLALFLQTLLAGSPVDHEALEYKRTCCQSAILFSLRFLHLPTLTVFNRDIEEVPHSRIIARMKYCGPVPRGLFATDGIGDLYSVESSILQALAGKHFGNERYSEEVFLVRPAVMHDDTTGRLILRRDLYTTEFHTPAVAELTIQRATRWLKNGQDLQQSVSFAFRAASTHDLAGKLVEGVMHCALSDGVALPEALHGGVLAATIEFRGTVDTFVLIDNNKVADPATTRPLYLRPAAVSGFPAIDAILATSPTQLVLFHTSLSETLHNWDFGTMLRIIARLPKLGVGIDLDSIKDIVCSVVGIPQDSYRVKNLIPPGIQSPHERKCIQLGQHNTRPMCNCGAHKGVAVREHEGEDESQDGAEPRRGHPHPTVHTQLLPSARRMCDIATAVKYVKYATFLWVLPFLPNAMASYTGLAIGFTSTAIYMAYRQTPSQKLGRRQEAITATADILNGAKQDCARPSATMLDLEDRLLQAQLTASETQVKLLKARDEETWTEYFDTLRRSMEDTNNCATDVREIHIETLLALEEEKQRKISSGMKETREVLAAIRSPIRPDPRAARRPVEASLRDFIAIGLRKFAVYSESARKRREALGFD